MSKKSQIYLAKPGFASSPIYQFCKLLFFSTLMASAHDFLRGLKGSPLCRITDKPEPSLPQWASKPEVVCPGVMPAFHTHLLSSCEQVMRGRNHLIFFYPSRRYPCGLNWTPKREVVPWKHLCHPQVSAWDCHNQPLLRHPSNEPNLICTRFHSLK